MNEKDYKAIAKILYDFRDNLFLINNLADNFEKNLGFNRKQFLRWCGVEE